MKRNLYIWGVVSVLGVLCACSANSDDNLDSNTILTGELITISEDYEGGRIVALTGDTLYAWSRDGRYTHSVATIKGDSIVPLTHIGRKGQGPGEFNQAAISIDNTHRIYLLDYNRCGLQVARVDMEDTDNVTVSMYEAMKAPDMTFVSDQFIVRDDSTILLMAAPWDDTQNIFTLYNFRNGDYKPLNYWPEDNYEGPAHSKFRFYADNSSLFTNGHGKFLYSAGNGRKAFVFTIKGYDVSVDHTMYDYPSSYRPDDLGLNYGYDYTGYELQPGCNDSIIVFLHCKYMEDGRTPGEREYGSYGNEITVWDWNGNQLGSYCLDHLVYSIIVNPSENSFISKGTDMQTYEDLMWSYRLPVSK